MREVEGYSWSSSVTDVPSALSMPGHMWLVLTGTEFTGENGDIKGPPFCS